MRWVAQMKTKVELTASVLMVILFFVTTSGLNSDANSSLNERLTYDIQNKAETGYSIIKAELSNLQELISVEASRLIFKNTQGEVLTIYKDETGLAVMKESTGIANMLSLQLEELKFELTSDQKAIKVNLSTERSIIHSSGDKVEYSGFTTGTIKLPKS